MTLIEIFDNKKKAIVKFNYVLLIVAPLLLFYLLRIPSNILLFLAEQISLMLFYYIKDAYQKNKLGTRSNKRHMISGVNIISGKASIQWS